MKMKKYIYITVLILAIGISSCKNTSSTKENHSEDTHKKSEQEVDDHEEEVMLTAQQFIALQMEIDTLKKRTISGFVEANGQLEVPPQNEASITATIGSNVVSIKVIEGDKVGKGQVVAYLSHPNIIQLQTDYLKAYSNSNFVKQDFERQKKLYDAGVGSGSTYQQAEASYNVSKSLVNGLGAQLQILNINVASVRKGNIFKQVPLLSPIEGYVQKVAIKTGQYVDPQTQLFEVVDTHHIHADLMVFEKDVHKVKEGQIVIFSVQSVPEEQLTAKIISVGKTFEENPKAVHIHAEIENKKDNLIPGMYIEGRIETDSKKGIALPESAIVKDGERFFVFSVEKENEDWSFKPVEILKGNTVDSWAAVNFLVTIDPNTKFAYNNAYYLLAEMKKGEAEHSH
ncbi:efflux RND transporter periplasmic adaptor subunit [Cellulophaga fucicola]|nr:efflux RND transporter periplasmic adaptor subunit [Cellulophaga fucicola]